jgi:hypothetical protein
MTPDNAWIYAVLPFVTMAALTFGFVVVFRQRAAARRAAATPGPPEPPEPPRAWWGSPWLWLAICAASVLLGWLVWPGLFALVLIVVPLVVLHHPSRRPRVDPRSNGHAHRDAGMFRPE